MNSNPFVSALQDFQRARYRAAVATIVSRLTGRSDDLLSYEDVRQKLHGMPSSRRELRDIPLDKIVGSVGRATDFNNQFLPRKPSGAERWARVKSAMESLEGVPPIDVYQIGDAYFVLDGNHRVSVAREGGLTHIQAWVTEVETRVAFSPDDSPDELIVKAEYADFLELTNLDRLRPNADLTMTLPGQYRALLDAIEAQRLQLVGEHLAVTFAEAAANWYDTAYIPTVEVIREHYLLNDFPNRTEADLFVWLSRHRGELRQQLGWEIDHDQAARDLARQQNERPSNPLAAVGKLVGALTSDTITPASTELAHRERAVANTDRLFSRLLVAVSGTEAGWKSVEQALVFAKLENGRLNGLHVSANTAAPAVLSQLQTAFAQRCAEAGVEGNLATAQGVVADLICERARFNDLVVVSLSYPPGSDPLTRLRSGLRALIQRSPRPLLAVPNVRPAINRVLLCYDGSPRAEEALYLAAYMAWRWRVALTVLTVFEGSDVSAKTQAPARRYLEGQLVRATFLTESGPVAEAILRVATEQQADLLLCGGYGNNALINVVLGHTVDRLLRESHVPVLICR